MKCHLAPRLALAAAFLPVVTSFCPSGSIVESGTQTPKLDIDATPIGLCFTQLGLAEPGSTVKIELDTKGDFDASSEYVDVYNPLATPRDLGRAQGRDRRNECGKDFTEFIEVTAEEYNTWVWRGVVFFGLDISTAVDGAQCNQNWVRLRVSIMQPYQPVMACPATSTIIDSMGTGPRNFENRGDTITFCFTDLPMATPMSYVDIRVQVLGDFDLNNEKVKLSAGASGDYEIGNYQGGRECEISDARTFQVDAMTYNSWVMDGVVIIRAKSTRRVGDEPVLPLPGIVKGEQCPSVIVVDDNAIYCNPGDPDFDPEGRVCENDGEANEAYCSYNVGPNACAYCGSDAFYCPVNLVGVKVTVHEPKCGSCVGDPHFQTWGEQWYDFHGICDLNMLKNDKFAEGKGMDIHVRTKARYQYSYIEAASIRIGEDIFEVGSWGQYWLNGVEGADLPAIMGEKYAVTHHSEHKRRHDFKISLTEAVEEAIVIRTVKDIVSVTVENGTYTHFGASEGLMGNYMTGAKLARDGTPMDDDNRFGQEWQVLPTEDKLFQSPSVYEFGNCKPPAFEVTAEGRRLGESRIATEAAEKACADVDADKKDMCIFDVKAMDDVEIADIHVSV